MPNKGYSNIACSDLKIAKALSRYLKFRFGFEKILFNPLKDPFRFRDALEMAEKSDFLIVDAFIDVNPKGFHFARQIGKKTLLLFYPGEIHIEHEGCFWFVLPYNLNHLGEKIKKMISQSATISSEYEKLEKRFQVLSESKGHHK